MQYAKYTGEVRGGYGQWACPVNKVKSISEYLKKCKASVETTLCDRYNRVIL